LFTWRRLARDVLLLALGLRLGVARLVRELDRRGGDVHRIDLGGEVGDDGAVGLEIAREYGLAQRRARQLEPPVPLVPPVPPVPVVPVLP
jgi:hypothetical protein